MLMLAAASLPGIWLAARGFVAFTIPRAAVAGSITGLAWQGFVLGLVGPGLVMSTVGAAIGGYANGIGMLSAASLTGALLALRYVIDSVAAPALGALADRMGLRRAAFTFFSLGAICLAIAGVDVSGTVFVASVIAFFVAATTLQAVVAGHASRYGSRAFAGYVTASDLGAAIGPLLGWWLIGVTGEPGNALVAGALVYVLALAGNPRARARLEGQVDSEREQR
jgi:hypothetical protein